MNRIIKFRAWDGKKMWQPFNAQDVFCDDAPGFAPDTLFLQFTGLHDKNDKEIYEGDVVSWERHTDPNNWASPMEHNPEYAQVVIFKQGCFIVDSTEQTLQDFIYDIVHKRVGAEIIGNIYEHPNLIP